MKSFIFNLIMVAGIIAGTVYVYNLSNNRREQYAIEHNCRYDYNDLCYTEEERPWLFK